jgi:hypothetical protein
METHNNPLLAKIKLPGRTFQLPSHGALYKNGEITGTEGEVHVHPMSALAEISLKNPDLLFNGKALEQVFAECVPEIKKPNDLYGRDIDALMYYLRLVTYGPNFEIKVKHSCEGAKDHSYMVDLEQEALKIKQLDPTMAAEEFQVTLPNGQVVKVHPVKFSHMIKLFQMNVGKKEFSTEDIKKNVVFNLTSLIESVDDITDRKDIEEWVSQITTPYQNKITSVIEKTNDWGPQQTVPIKCKDCEETFDVELPLNPISFFTE